MTPTTTLTPLEEQAITLISPIKFHQILTIPATDAHGPLKVTYSVIGPQHGDVPTILFIGGMFGSRWMSISLNSYAERQGVRILFIDRPGFGGSTPVSIHLRISVFLETVPLLLTHLRIPTLSVLASHSAGTIYALNVLYHLPHLLSPSAPRVMLFSPWVHQSISRMSSLQIAAMLPDALIDQWDSLTRFMTQKVSSSPIFKSSVGVAKTSCRSFRSVRSLMGGERQESKEEKAVNRVAEEKKCWDLCGYALEMDQILQNKSWYYALAESIKGGNDEARLCLKSVPNLDWDAYESLPVLITHLMEVWTTKVEGGGKALKLQLVFGQKSDSMIGDKGRKYFEESWVSEDFGGAVEVKVLEVEGGNHDSVVELGKGAIELMVSDAKREV